METNENNNNQSPFSNESSKSHTSLKAIYSIKNAEITPKNIDSNSKQNVEFNTTTESYINKYKLNNSVNKIHTINIGDSDDLKPKKVVAINEVKQESKQELEADALQDTIFPSKKY